MMLWDELALRAFFEEQPAVHHALSETNPRHSTLTFTLTLSQVEQPFQMLPLWQLCHLVQFNIEEALSSPELPLQVVRTRQTDVPGAERFDVDDDFVDEEAERLGLPPIWPRGANGA